MQPSIIYVVGASGSGKDTLINYARKQLAAHPNICFAHRYITRVADAGGENHVALTPEEFMAREQAGLFAMHWSSHGLHYGIGLELNQWLSQGMVVVINGSRSYLTHARQRYPNLLALGVEVGVEVLRQRLSARAREDATAIEQRLARHQQMMQHTKNHPDSLDVIIHNHGTIDEAGETLIQLILSQIRAATT